MDFIKKWLEYFMGPQGDYRPIDFSSPDYEQYHRFLALEDEPLGLLNLSGSKLAKEELYDKVAPLFLQKKINRGVVLYNKQVYLVNCYEEKLLSLSELENGQINLKKKLEKLQSKGVCKPETDILIKKAFNEVASKTWNSGGALLTKKDSSLNLYNCLHLEFSDKIDERAQREEGQEESFGLKNARTILAEVEKLASKRITPPNQYVKEEVDQLNQILIRSITAITQPITEEEKSKYLENATQMALLAKQLPRYSGPGWKILHYALISLAVSAIMFGILCAFPTFGASLSLSFMGAFGLSAILSGMTLAASPLGAALGISATAAAAGMWSVGGAATTATLYKTKLHEHKGLAKGIAEIAEKIKKDNEEPKP